MKYFIDTEFIEGFHKPLFAKRRHFIDLISIAIVCEDGREYYAISTEFNPKDADPWVKENVISKLPDRYVDFNGSPRRKEEALRWKSLELIKYEILEFTDCWRDELFWRAGKDKPEFYAYYGDYDWVVFCSLFGRMIDLPKGYPMYCKDLKQMLDEKEHLYPHGFSVDARFPKQENEHSALDDARWNKKLYDFLQTI